MHILQLFCKEIYNTYIFVTLYLLVRAFCAVCGAQVLIRFYNHFNVCTQVYCNLDILTRSLYNLWCNKNSGDPFQRIFSIMFNRPSTRQTTRLFLTMLIKEGRVVYLAERYCRANHVLTRLIRKMQKIFFGYFVEGCQTWKTFPMDNFFFLFFPNQDMITNMPLNGSPLIFLYLVYICMCKQCQGIICLM